jgi:hypothetical protein
MRRLVGFTVLALALAIPAFAFAAIDLSDDGSLSVKNGFGKVTLSPFNGSALGRVGKGVIVVTDPVLGDGGSYDLWGCERQKDLTDHVTRCAGTNLRFRVVDGRYKVTLAGTGINLSAVGRGQVSLDGRGEDPAVDSDGFYALNDGPYRSLPDSEKTLSLVSPVGG